MSEIIHAWVYDPQKALFGAKGQKSSCLTVRCENPGGCDLYTKFNTCTLLGSEYTCVSGKKTREDGPTQRARSFYDWLQKKRDWCQNVSHGLKPFKAYNRIFRTNGWYHLPYPAMSDAFLMASAPIKNSWIQEEDLTAEVLHRICTAIPRNIFGDQLVRYQNETVPKFIMDLMMHYPNLFEMLAEDQKDRVKVYDFTGRTAVLATVASGPVVLSKETWIWDGKTLTREAGTFLPVKGRMTSALVPDPSVTVKITDNSQVTAETEFVD